MTYLKSDDHEDMIYDPVLQAENVARLAEVANEIVKAVESYYSKDERLRPEVTLHSNDALPTQ
ncbi:MAG: hypothetical protein NC418_02475 [Muribaculaceae bacterium]|nr:hypothetical protein [Muribaculaceae bacterium]